MLSFFAGVEEVVGLWISDLHKGLVNLNSGTIQPIAKIPAKVPAPALIRKRPIRQVAESLFELSIPDETTDQSIRNLLDDFAAKFEDEIEADKSKDGISDTYEAADTLWKEILDFSTSVIDACDRCPGIARGDDFVIRRRELSVATETLRTQLNDFLDKLEALEDCIPN